MPADLFNVRTVGRLSRKVKVSNKQKNAAKLWLMNLDAGKLTAERHNYIKFANGVLRDILGYPEREIEEAFEKGGVEFLFTNEEEQKVVCFELKGSDQDLFSTQHRLKKEQETPIKQTWDYMGKHNLDYGVTSNFREFVLIDKNKGYSKVHRFEFTSIKSEPTKLNEFIAIFSKKNLIVDTFAEVLYKESIIEERAFTKEFYKLFHETRLMLLKEFIDSGATQEQAIHYAQIFLNRLMFVLFAEDTGKLPRRLPEDRILEVLKNRLIINEHSNMVYEAIIGLYRQLDTGAKTPVELFGFNGELFKEEIPRTFFFNDMREESYFKDVYQQSALKKSKQQDIIESNILSKVGKGISPIIANILLMASLDFTTEVNVNILGHIFEQSITDIEKLQEGEASKRKKEGIYYTPEYITDYICRNTIIPYLSKNNAATTVEELIDEHKDNFEVLEKKLKDLRILDPACGSGAFLIKAVDVLLEIHKALIEAKAVQGKYEKRVLGKRGQEERYHSFSKYYDEDEARKIIEDNIYGVDINEESVEITKLSLYLKIAREKKKLLDLSKNIKCGNSLIDDPEVAGDKAFNWKKEFPELLNQGGFEIIIGNPPYIPTETMSNQEKSEYLKKFNCLERKYDSSIVFILNSLKLLNDSGYLSFISSVTWHTGENYIKFRKFLIEHYGIEYLINLPFDVFEDAYVDTGIYVLSTKKKQIIKGCQFDKKFRITKIENLEFNQIRLEDIKPPDYKIIISTGVQSIHSRIRKKPITELGDISISAQGLSASRFKLYSKKEAQTLPFLYKGQGYRYNLIKNVILYADMSKHQNLVKFYKKQPKIFVRRIISRQNRLMACYEEDDLVTKKDLNPFIIMDSLFKPKFILALLNSSLISYLYTQSSTIALKDDFRQTTLAELKKIPIIQVDSKTQDILASKADSMLKLNKECNEKKSKFLRRISSYFGIEKYSKKLDSFWMFSFDDFQKEVYRLSKKKLSLKEQDEWEDYFNDYKEELTELQQKTDETDMAIDQMVYRLYELTPGEIKIVEEGI